MSSPAVLSRLGALAALSLLLASCAAESAPPVGGVPNAPAPADGNPLTPTQDASADPGGGGGGGDVSAQGSATLNLSGITGSFVLASCIITDEDILLHGPGRIAETAEVAYLDIDFLHAGEKVEHGGLRVDLGTTNQFSSSDEFYSFDPVYFSGEHTLELRDDGFVLTAEFRDQDTASVGSGTLTVHCP